ncbi:hypothetical protein M1506_02215 [Patescibacteria group bacterium]|nr:hypothetical protein [Patescibacteria group bacterium]
MRKFLFIGFLVVEVLFTVIGWLTLGEGTSVFVLTLTAFFIADQAVATRKMVEVSQRPSVDIAVIFQKGFGTSFQILNRSAIPAIVWLKAHIEIDDKSVDPTREKELLGTDRLTGKESFPVGLRDYVTASIFLTELTEKKLKNVRIIITIDVAPTFNEKARYFYQKKSYRFDPKKLEWVDENWGIADEVAKKFGPRRWLLK